MTGLKRAVGYNRTNTEVMVGQVGQMQLDLALRKAACRIG